jgi:hypothetical protein
VGGVAAQLTLFAQNIMEPSSQRSGGTKTDLLSGNFRWVASGPLLSPLDPPGDVRYSIKDPSVVFYNSRWHLFCTTRGQKRTHAVEYFCFQDWGQANKTLPHVLNSITAGYFCAPQVFHFTPHKKWYLIYQAPDPAYEKGQCPCFSTTQNIEDPRSWSVPTPFYKRRTEDKPGLDYWVICDDAKAHLFYTTLDGSMWRREAKLGDFPHGWGEPQLLLQGDIFEASHTYCLKGLGKYLTIVEADTKAPDAWRYFKAYLADRPEGPWNPLADTLHKPFAGMANVKFQGPRWSDSISHGELLRLSYDQKMEVDPAHLKFLFQGVPNAKRTANYGQIPWQLGILEPCI